MLHDDCYFNADHNILCIFSLHFHNEQLLCINKRNEVNVFSLSLNVKAKSRAQTIIIIISQRNGVKMHMFMCICSIIVEFIFH